MMAIFDFSLVVWLMALAAYIAAVRDDQTAILGFMALGLLVVLGWLRLGSVDVALTEAAIGSGVTGLLLLNAEARTRSDKLIEKLPDFGVKAAAAMLSILVTAALCVVVLSAPSPAPTLAPAAAASLATTGLGNPVTAVLLAYRALDTLLETVVLLFALIGVWSLTSDRLWGGAPQLRSSVVPEPLAYLARVLPPFGVLVSVYLFWVGADEPGGKFQAGTILAAMWIIVMISGLRAEPQTSNSLLKGALVAGPITFLCIGFLGVVTTGKFLAYPEGMAKPLILIIEAPLTISIAAMLALLVAGPSKKAPA